MDSKHKAILKSNRSKIRTDLSNASTVAVHLYGLGAISKEDQDEIMAEKLPIHQTEKLLDILPKRGPGAFDAFCDVLREVNSYLESLLRPTENERPPTYGEEQHNKPANTQTPVTGDEKDAAVKASGGDPASKREQPTGSDRLDGGGFFGSSATRKPASTASGVDKSTVYKMDKEPRGIALIINNKNFLRSSGMERYPRNGTDVDAEGLEQLFTSLKFQVVRRNDATVYEIRQLFKEAQRTDHSNYNAFFCSILTHGEEGIIYGTDGTLDIRELTGMLRPVQSLVGKPKIFIFQACQGHEYMDGLEAPLDVTDSGTGEDEIDGGKKVQLPSEADFLFAYSTVPGYYSWRNSVRGSWFIQSIIEVFSEQAKYMDLLRMLTRVNNKVSENKSKTNDYFSDNKMQISTIASQLRKELFFFPELVDLK